MKTAQLRIRIEPALHRAFLEACRADDRSAAHVLRECMRSYVEHHEFAKQPDLFIARHVANDKGSNQ